MKLFYVQIIIEILFSLQQQFPFNFRDRLDKYKRINRNKKFRFDIFNRLDKYDRFDKYNRFDRYNRFEDYDEEEDMQIEPIDVKDLNFSDALTNISKVFNDKILDMSMQINNLINHTLDSQSELFKKAKLEQKDIKKMLKEIKKLKERYKRNVIFSYIIGSIILFTFFIFYCLNHKKSKIIKGYKNPVQSQNENNQLDIV